MKSVYLSGPIYAASFDESYDWRARAAELFGPDYHMYDPLRGRPKGSKEELNPAEAIMRDKNDILKSDYVLVNLEKKCCMMGTPMEILYAWEHEKPVIIFSEWAKEHYWASYHSVKILPTLEECVDYIKTFWG